MPTGMCKPLSFCIHQTVIDSGLLDSDQPFSRNEIGSSPLSLWLGSPPKKLSRHAFLLPRDNPSTPNTYRKARSARRRWWRWCSKTPCQFEDLETDVLN